MSLPILNYHAIDTSGQVIATDPAWFVETIEQLVAAGFVGVDLPAWIARGRPEIANGFAVTFDDGLRSLLKGVDVLERHQIPATIFLITNYVGRDNNWPSQPKHVQREAMLDWSDVADLSNRGFSFGAHSATHSQLAQLPDHQLSDEIRECRSVIESRTHRPCNLFAYPYGGVSSMVRDRVESAYDAGFGTRLDLADVASPLFGLPRIDAYYLRSPRVLDRLIAGRLRPWLRYRRGLRTVKRLVSR